MTVERQVKCWPAIAVNTRTCCTTARKHERDRLIIDHRRRQRQRQREHLPACGAIGCLTSRAMHAAQSSSGQRMTGAFDGVADGSSKPRNACAMASASPVDRKSVVEGKSVSVRVALGGRRIIKKKKYNK